MAQHLLLDGAAGVVEELVGYADDMERIGDLGHIRQHRVGDRPPGVGPVREPGAHRGGVTALDDIEQLVVTDELGRPDPMLVGPETYERGLTPMRLSP